MGSLAGAAHLLKHNAGVLRGAQWGQKPHVDHKGTSLLDSDFQYEWEPGNGGLTVLIAARFLGHEVSEKLPQG